MFRRLRRLLGKPAPAGPSKAPPSAAVRAPPPPEPVATPSPEAPHTLRLFKFDACPFCIRVQRALRGMDLTVEMRDTRRDDGAAAELRALTGGAQVPCLEIDGIPLLESRDIVAWLEEHEAWLKTQAAPA